MMGWLFSAGKSLRRPARESRRAPRRKRSLILEGLEGRQLLSQAIQPLVSLPIHLSGLGRRIALVHERLFEGGQDRPDHGQRQGNVL